MKNGSGSASTPLEKESRHTVALSCPDCSGVLHLEHEGPQDYSLYLCQIDHRYSTRSLIHAKELQLERTLWAGHVLLKQTLLLYDQALKRPDGLSAADRKAMRRRIHEVRKQCLAIRAMVEASHAFE